MNESSKKLQEAIRPEYFFWAAVVCSLFFVLNVPETGVQETAAAATVIVEAPEDPYAALELSAKAAYVYDVKAEKPLFAKNAIEPLPLASIAKVMTAITALSYVPETTYITIEQRAIQEEGDNGFKVGERWLLRDILAFTLLESSNDGAVAVSSSIGSVLATTTENAEGSRTLFIRKMNERAEEIGLKSTYFLNETGLDLPAQAGLSETEAGAFASASDTAHLLAYALEKYPQVFTETRWSDLVLGTEGGKEYTAHTTNKGANDVPLLMASKTGYTDLAGGNLVIAFDAGFNHPIIVAVLGSTEEDRFTDVEQLVWATLAYLQQN